jgi:hypothetical protein
MRQWACLFGRHQWHKVFDPETKKRWLECRRCGRRKVPFADDSSLDKWGPAR